VSKLTGIVLQCVVVLTILVCYLVGCVVVTGVCLIILVCRIWNFEKRTKDGLPTLMRIIKPTYPGQPPANAVNTTVKYLT